VDTAQAEFRRQEAGLARLRQEVPIQVEIARRTLATAQADEARAKDALKLTEDEVTHGIAEAKAALAAAKADLVFAEQGPTPSPTVKHKLEGFPKASLELSGEPPPQELPRAVSGSEGLPLCSRVMAGAHPLRSSSVVSLSPAPCRRCFWFSQRPDPAP
jgi:hypothetical protein